MPDKKQKSVLALSTANPNIHWGVVVDVCVGCVTWIWFLFGWFWLTGKTLAFGIPAVMHVLKKRKSKASKGRNPLCLVLSPTRELAQQVCYCLCTGCCCIEFEFKLIFLIITCVVCTSLVKLKLASYVYDFCFLTWTWPRPFYLKIFHLETSSIWCGNK